MCVVEWEEMKITLGIFGDNSNVENKLSSHGYCISSVLCMFFMSSVICRIFFSVVCNIVSPFNKRTELNIYVLSMLVRLFGITFYVPYK